MTASESLQRRTRSGLEDLGVRPRKALGQNFLVAPHIVERIVAAARIADRRVVEIGPGMGALSDRLAAEAAELVLVEVDPRMAERLRTHFESDGRVRVIAGDALRITYQHLIPGPERAVVVANLPYSVASQILIRLIDARACFERLVLMLQREVAERLVASPGGKDYGLPSIWVALYGRAEILFRVPPGAFVPRPKVESAVVSIELQVEPRVPLGDEKRFREIVRAAFGQRRKTLRAALSKFASGAQILDAGVDPMRRGETLSLEEFAALARAIDAGDHA